MDLSNKLYSMFYKIGSFHHNDIVRKIQQSGTLERKEGIAALFDDDDDPTGIGHDDCNPQLLLSFVYSHVAYKSDLICEALMRVAEVVIKYFKETYSKKKAKRVIDSNHLDLNRNQGGPIATPNAVTIEFM
ncbi:unnamed protein product [Arctia plantaginis]|uniref:Uncharacterized protein n=1 Tax=Arctia plantaginis TaxID=874455 RepID=A0A8S1BGZ4_ARCPL|nr:unnamed protein product [Arctia plantaginis]